MAFAFHEQDADTLLYEERVSTWARLFIAAIGLAMLGGAAGMLILFASQHFPTFSALLTLMGAATFVILAVFLLRHAWNGTARTVFFDGRDGTFVSSGRNLAGKHTSLRHTNQDVSDIRVVTHDFEGSLPDYSVEIALKTGDVLSLGFWQRREEAEAWAEKLRRRLIRDNRIGFSPQGGR